MAAIPITAPEARGDEQDQGQRLPAGPGAECGEKLEVAEAHAFLAGEELEAPVHAPEQEVAAGRAQHGRAQVDEEAARVDEEPQPEQRHRDASGRSCVSRSIAEAAMQRPGEDERRGERRAPAEAPGEVGRGEPGEELDQRVAHADGRLAGRALAAAARSSSRAGTFCSAVMGVPQDGQRERGVRRLQLLRPRRLAALELRAVGPPLRPAS